jgi:uncharacterized protein
MRLMCISDIHGNIECLEKAIEKFREENAEKLIILGDFSSYYFSSTDFEVAEMLNNMAGAIIAVKGNCDNSKTEDIFNFSLAYLRNIIVNNIKITLTHGHIYNRNNLPEDCGQIFLYGHTHVGNIEKIEDRIIANPGSISKPRSGSSKSYIIIDEENIILKKLSGEVIKKINHNLKKQTI